MSYALADEPQGFFKFMVGVIEDLLQSLTKMMTHSSVHCSIRQLLKQIYSKLLEIPFDEANDHEARKPNPEFVV